MKRVLLNQKEPQAAHQLAALLSEQGFDALAVRTGAKLLTQVHGGTWDLIILDVDLPQGDGFAICRQVRMNTITPVMFLTARSDDESLIKGLNAGADDYVIKPVSAPVFLARLYALLRRAGCLRWDGTTVIRRGPLVMDLERHEVSIADRNVNLTPIEFRLLAYLAENPGRALSPRSLVKEIQGYDCSNQEARNVIKVHVHNLRRKVSSSGENPFRIENVRGIGYKFDRRQITRERGLNFVIA